MKRILVTIVVAFVLTKISFGQEVANDINICTSIIFKSQVLKEDRIIQVYLPEDYHDSKTKYPVFYVLDGQRYFLNGITFQQNLAWQELVPNFIVIGIVTDAQKRRTLFYDESLEFIEYLEKELIPKIDKDYRTLDTRIYFGWEMAAGLGIEILAEFPKLFEGYLLASPTHISENRLQQVAKMLTNDPQQKLTAYTTLGTVENWALAGMASLDSIFKNNARENIRWKYLLSENENHYTTPLSSIDGGLKMFFDDYGPLRFYSIKEFIAFGGLEALKKHYTNRANKYQIPFVIHDDTKHYLLSQSHKEGNFEIFKNLMEEFNGKTFIASYYKQARWFSRYAALYLENNDLVESFDILELGIKKFPNASILHNEMGNYYKLSGQSKKARKWYKKAIAIAQQNHESEVTEYVKNLKLLK